MSQADIYGFEQKLAFHAAPTIFGKKCGSLVSFGEHECDLEAAVSGLYRKRHGGELKARIAKSSTRRELLYVYHTGRLGECLGECGVRKFLENFGYCGSWNAEQCLDRLCERLANEDFPHEIGIFLGYPLEDVIGFIKNCGQHCKYCGGWKVYGDVNSAKKQFECYRRCRDKLCSSLESGRLSSSHKKM